MGRLSVRLIPVYRKNKQKAIKLGRKEWSYKEIANKFKISKDTAYLWTKKVNKYSSLRNPHLTGNNTELACRVKGWIQGISEKI